MRRPSHDDLRRAVEALSSIHRPSASRGELDAARHVADELGAAGFQARIELERATGNYWLPLGLLSLAGIGAGVIGARRSSRRSRYAAGLAGALAAAAVFDDVSAGRHAFRRILPRRNTFNVVAETGPADAEQTIVLHAHHDSAKSGLIFDPRIPETAYRLAPDVMEANKTGPPVMAPVFGGPALAALGAFVGSRQLAGAGIVFSAAITAIMADIALRKTVPGANDNASGVVCLAEVARRLAAKPLERTRLILLSTGSEESLLEGMAGFARRHFHRLDRNRTFFFCLDTVGSEQLLVLRGEGMLQMRDYPATAVDLVAAEADQIGVELLSDVRNRNSTDALYPLKAGYPTVMLGSINEFRVPANYHWRSDTPANIDYASIADAVILTETVLRRLDRSWLN